MSSSATDPTKNTETTEVSGKGKGKAVEDSTKDVEMDEEDDDDDDDEEENEGTDEEESEEEDNLDEIDPSAIIGSRRTRGVKIDYTSEAALAKAGLKKDELEADDDDEEMKA